MREMLEIASHFQTDGKPVDIQPFGNGHIHDTYVVTCQNSVGKQTHYLLQQINSYVFPRPEQVMENVVQVTGYLKNVLRSAGEDPQRRTLTVIPTKGGHDLYRQDWVPYRMYLYVENTFALDTVTNVSEAYYTAFAYGQFQQMLEAFPAEKLHETIPHFHDTPFRYREFCKTVQEDKCGRVRFVLPEIAFVEARAEQMSLICEELRQGRIPWRVTHNDAKINNLLMDLETGYPLCVVDLDTVMPGSMLYDFGDMVRSTMVALAKTGEGYFSLPLYEALQQGFLDGCSTSITMAELELFPAGAWMMILECGMRFLMDYLQGDVYFKTAHLNHNLDRARMHFEILAQLECQLG